MYQKHVIIQINQPVSRIQLKKIPQQIGVYLFKSNKEYIYIGKSINLRLRLLSHFEDAKIIPKEKKIFSLLTHIEYIPLNSEFDSLITEAQLIQKYKPKYNVIWKDNKSYLYIKITHKERYPKIFITRKENKTNSLYFGPFGSKKNVEEILRFLRQIFPFCNQKNISLKPCFYSKIGLCNPCPNAIEKINNILQKKEMKRIYNKNIKNIVKILKGNISPVITDIQKSIRTYSQNADFEQALILRNTLYKINDLINKRSFNQHQTEGKITPNITLFIKKYFPSIKKIRRIECYDISNISQKKATASMIVSISGLLDKSEYKKFKIKNMSLRSDFQMLKETIIRRMNNKWDYPDLIIIDGGYPQVRQIKELLTSILKPIPIVGIAKNPDRLVLGDDNYTRIKPSLFDPVFNFIRLMRDESHRFAKKYHLYLRDREIV